VSEKDLAAILREEAALAETEEDSDDDVWVRSRRPPKAPSMVYSVRIPVSRVEELRRVATEAGMEPSAMVRQWVLDRLDSELSEEGRAVEGVKSALEHVLKAFKRKDDSSWGVLLTPDSESLLTVVPRPALAKRASAKTTKARSSKATVSRKAASKTTKVSKAAKVPAKVAGPTKAVMKTKTGHKADAKGLTVRSKERT
jgi:hypothetical protein